MKSIPTFSSDGIAVTQISNILATLSIALSGLLGTGGAGYALIQWWTRRNDDETKANAARVLTDAATGFVVELRKEKQTALTDLSRTADELHRLRVSTRRLLVTLVNVLDCQQHARVAQMIADVEANL